MKNIIFTTLFLTSILQLKAQVTFTALSFSPQFPQANSKVNFEYNSNYSPLIKQKNIKVAIYLYNGKGKMGYQIIEPNTKNKEGIYNGTFEIDSSTNLFAFSFTSDTEKDINKNEGYLIPIYSKNNLPTKNYYQIAPAMQFALGRVSFGMETNDQKALEILEEGIKLFPELKSTASFLRNYIFILEMSKKYDATPIIKNELDLFATKDKLIEEDYQFLIDGYSKIKSQEKSDSFSVIMKGKYPNGDWEMEELVNNFFKEDDANKKAAIYLNIEKKYPSSKEYSNSYADFRSQVVKYYSYENNIIEFEKWNKTLIESMKASNNNDFARLLLKQDSSLVFAKKIAMEAALFAKYEQAKPTETKPDDLTKKQWQEKRGNEYAKFADTYAYILFKLKDYKIGFPFAKEAATINKFQDPEINEHYSLLAEKVLPLLESKKIIEGFVKAGTATSKTKEALERLFNKEKLREAGFFTTYLSKLEANGKEVKKTTLIKSMLNEASPNFTLIDFEGKEVTLESLKGKIVVLDFWATWCAPCIASMPAMNIALAKYKDNENVKFLFIDTWEREENKLKNAKDFMASKNYPFQVLMDDMDIMATDFKVSGIPAKFIIDKKGIIRFKASGFSGNDDDMVEELSIMIELAEK